MLGCELNENICTQVVAPATLLGQL